MGLSLCLFTFMPFVFSLIFFNFTIATNFNASKLLQTLCHDDERSALLQFKESLIVTPDAWSPCHPKAASWKLEEGNNTDCCSWDGVECNDNTGYVIKLDLSSSCLRGSINTSSSIFQLVHLEWLNLADNDFSASEIPVGITNYPRLSYLNLSGSFFSGQIPSEILELSNLESLDLSVNSDLQLKNPSFRNLVEKLTNLKELDLGDVAIASPLPHNLANLSTLTFLSLSRCKLQGGIPITLSNLTKLIHLDLSSNELTGELPASIGNLGSLKQLDFSSNGLSGELPIPMGNLVSLEELHFSYNGFSGELPAFIGNLRSLEELEISYCNFSGQIPISLGNLSHLQSLVLAANNFSGELPASIGNLSSLEILDVTSCKFSNQVPSSLGNLRQLQSLYLASNNFMGEFPATIGNLRPLKGLFISFCKFSGRIPSSLSNLTQLNFLDLSRNNFSGTTDLDLFLNNLKNLYFLSLSSNSLSLYTKATFHTTSKNFSFVGLSSCGLTEFPNFLINQKQLVALDLSSNKIPGKIPRWLLDPSMQTFSYLNLSHNFLTGFDQHDVVLSWASDSFILDLSFNYIQGPLPVPPPQTRNYLVSNNSLTGEIPSWICNLNSLESLDLSHNSLSGLLPRCLGNFSDQLSILDLQGNNFFGTIPDTFTNGSKLMMIDLSSNLLQGRIPRSLSNCTGLEFLDLGNNQISDTFPAWLGTLSDLNILILQSNNFHGVISEPKTECGFPKLRIIDLSNNSFAGKLPSKYFQCWNGMKFVNTSRLRYMQGSLSSDFSFHLYGFFAYFDYSLTMRSKGQMLTYNKIPDILTGIILSSNKFDGEIPTSIANLKELQILSLANNNLHGHIPSSLGKLNELESLDLSNNNLSGRIPHQLVELTFLGFFSVSHNNLTGPIPQGNQFFTFSYTSFDGNPGLCGKPLSKECENPETRTNEDDDQDSESLFAFDWKIVLIGYFGGLIAGVALGVSFSPRIVDWFLEKFGGRSKRMRRNRRRRN